MTKSDGQVKTAAPVQGSMNLLNRLARVIYRRATEEVIGIRLKQLIVLELLRELGESTQQQLGRSLMLDPNNTVILLNDLEDAGYVLRRRDPSDRRRHIVEMTADGVRALEHAEEKLETVEDEVLGNLNGSERATLRKLLAKALEGKSADGG
jgi:MarR family transcriptional regulator, temperature-dependent positive regulator of motility